MVGPQTGKTTSFQPSPMFPSYSVSMSHNWELFWVGEGNIKPQEGGKTTIWSLNMAGMVCYGGNAGSHHQTWVFEGIASDTFHHKANVTLFIYLPQMVISFLLSHKIKLINFPGKMIIRTLHTDIFFSTFNTHINYLRILLCFCRFGIRPKPCICDKRPGGADAARPHLKQHDLKKGRDESHLNLKCHLKSEFLTD